MKVICGRQLTTATSIDTIVEYSPGCQTLPLIGRGRHKSACSFCLAIQFTGKGRLDQSTQRNSRHRIRHS